MATCASSTIKIVAKEKTVSPIWTYFGLEAYDDGKPVSKDNAIYRLCETPVPSKGGSTSNMFSHLKCHHPKKYAELTQAIAANKLSSSNKRLSSKPSSSGPQPTILEVVNKSKQYEKNGKKWQVLTDSITRCLCKDMLPMYTVEKAGFREMLKKFDAQYEVPSRKYFSGTAIPTMYSQVRDKVVEELSNMTIMLPLLIFGLVKLVTHICATQCTLLMINGTSNVDVCKHCIYLLIIMLII